jgi:hypothetical protein
VEHLCGTVIIQSAIQLGFIRHDRNSKNYRKGIRQLIINPSDNPVKNAPALRRELIRQIFQAKCENTSCFAFAATQDKSFVKAVKTVQNVEIV